MYITKVGKFLRKTSLDELPQIINIIKGEMSIIGPRPADNNKEGAESHKLESESKPIWKSMSMFLVPLLLSNVLQSVGQLFGMVVVGRWLGVNDLAAISAFFPLFFLLVSFVIGIGSGSSILIGQAFGAKNEDRLKA
ncbi:sugar transferase, partial [Bacillus sp. HC-Mk]